MQFLNTKEVAKLLEISTRRVRAKIKSNHFPNATHCSCERKSWLIPETDLKIKEEKNVTF